MKDILKPYLSHTLSNVTQQESYYNCKIQAKTTVYSGSIKHIIILTPPSDIKNTGHMRRCRLFAAGPTRFAYTYR